MDKRNRFVNEVARIADEIDRLGPRTGPGSRKIREYATALFEALAEFSV